MTAVWHGREPDVRCEFLMHSHSTDRCHDQAIVVMFWNEGRLGRRPGGRAYCDKHAWTAGDPSFRPDRTSPLIRDPRPIALLCGAIAGAWSSEMERLLAQSLDRHASAEDRAGAEAILLDLAEERGLESGGWAATERRWLPTLREEVLPILEGVSVSRPARLIGRMWDEVFAGNVTWSVGGWLVRVFNDCGEWDYIDSLVTPDGREVEYDELPDVIRFWEPRVGAGWPSLIGEHEGI